MPGKFSLTANAWSHLNQLADNQRECLGYIRRMGESSRDEIGRYFGWKPATISRIIKPLLDNGVLLSHSHMAPEQGRRRAYLYLDPDQACAIGVEITFTDMRAALVNLGGKILHCTEKVNNAKIEPEETVKRLGKMLDDLCEQYKEHPILGVGISFGGSLPNVNDASRCFPDTITWEHFPLADSLSRVCSLPIKLHPETVASMLAELRFGLAQKCDNVLYVYMINGIGLGIVVNGVIHAGSSNLGGELGHICVQPQGPFCYCGGKGCLESIASSWAILKQVRERLKGGVYSRHLARLGPGNLTLAEICQSVVNGDAFALDILATAGEWLGISVANIAGMLDPSKIILGGILADGKGYQPILKSMEEAYRRNVHFYRSDPIDLTPSSLGADSNVIGAAASVFEHVLPAFPPQLPSSVSRR